ncbi:Isochorismatase family protein YecD [Aliiroseovarius sp. xm-m-379]|uniref:cysteine hydrolase family protein n=1 Tax=unclassified Aliiroseovarius TaxID=2623558 RepID=UPI00156A2F73|nr:MULTISPECIES: cysteine hydrolase family protein [unclassified Aliiroseovarius]NRP24640.1 Isochorismatase family protein YecD [Aliiroseovarius sp. xm-m-379]NRP33439.1 Isochorismatase family protein YecD [Aliiroseovarius sp. xm-a-104]NRQ20559.1 Isochorismatase family protein YecD [Aliiroseovarius sp. xm-v-204]
MVRALIIVDIQQGFDDPYWGARNNPDAEQKAGQLLAHWRAQGWPAFLIQHLSTNPDSPLFPGKPGVELHPAIAPKGEAVIQKSANSAFIGTDLEERLRTLGATDLVVAGITTPHCVSTTCRMAANLGFNVTLVHDATAAFAEGANTAWREGGPVDPEQIHQSAIDHISGEFVTVKSVAEVLV